MKGDNKELDRKYEQYKKMRLWWGSSYCVALSNEDIDIMAKLWNKEMTPSKLTVDDVSKLVAGFWS